MEFEIGKQDSLPNLAKINTATNQPVKNVPVGFNCQSKCAVTAFVVGEVVAVLFMGLAIAKMFGPLGSHAHVGAMVGGGIVFLISTGGIIYFAVQSCQKKDEPPIQNPEVTKVYQTKAPSNVNSTPKFQLIRSEKLGENKGQLVYLTDDGTLVTYPNWRGCIVEVFKDKGGFKFEKLEKRIGMTLGLHSFDNKKMVVRAIKDDLYQGIFVFDFESGKGESLCEANGEECSLAISGDYVVIGSNNGQAKNKSTIEVFSFQKRKFLYSIAQHFSLEKLTIIGDKVYCSSSIDRQQSIQCLYSLQTGKLLFSNQESTCEESTCKKSTSPFSFKHLKYGENIFFGHDGNKEEAKTLIYSLDGSKLGELQGTIPRCLVYDKDQKLLVCVGNNGQLTEIEFWSLADSKLLQKLTLKENDITIMGGKFIKGDLVLSGTVLNRNFESYPYMWKIKTPIEAVSNPKKNIDLEVTSNL